MSDNIEYPKNPGKGKVFAGIILLGLGIIFLMHQLDFFFFPHWLFRWPMWLIVWGVYMGARHDFRNSSWLIMILIGMAFLLNDALPGYNVSSVVWPLAIIIFGLWLILRRNHTWEKPNKRNKWEDKWKSDQYRNGNPFDPITPVTPEPVVDPIDPLAEPLSTGPAASSSSTFTSSTANPLTGDDVLDTVSVFGGVKKTILSKNFRGGEIVNIFGGAEIDLTQADINGRVIIDITQIFGGTKIVVPSNWQVVSDLAAVFGSIDDKRIQRAGAPDANKILVIKGVSIFAGVDVRSY